MTSPDTQPPSATDSSSRWYHGVGKAQWQVLTAASVGWVFDAYASQIYNITRGSMLSEVLKRPPGDPSIQFWGEVFLGIYLVGGAIGGTLFGSLADRFGRRPTMIATILTYTVFSGLTALAHDAWVVAVLRFIVALGTAGAWAVGASLVAEVFSAKSRAQAGAIFHSTSNVGTWLASLVGMVVGANWRMAYFTGAIPILIVFLVRANAEESASWKEEAQKKDSAPRGSFRELLTAKPWGKRAIFGMLLAAVGLGTYWCLTVGGQDLIQEFLVRQGVSADVALSRAQFGYGFLINGGGFIGAIAFGPFAQKLGRKRAFTWAMVGGAVIVPLTWYLPQTYAQLLVLLPFYGLLTFGFHSGFAFYFPELFPVHLRGTGAGFCFNGGRLLAAGVLAFSGFIKSRPGIELRQAACLLSLLYLLGLVFIRFLPETKNAELAH